MKTLRNILYGTLLILSLSSCDKWLEATSSSQVSDQKMFSTRNGFHEALTGVYISMGSSGAYGRNYSFYVNELSAVECYNSLDATAFRYIQNHQYNSQYIYSVFEEMWQSGYFSIANINKILFELENRPDVVVDNVERNLIKGELLALRAYIHFDLIRMFGLSSWDGENADKLTVPYVTGYTLEITEQKSYRETSGLLHKDIEEALKCLECDPVRGVVSDDFYETVNTDGYWNNRLKHMNYYAAKALEARLWLWEGDYTKADEAAAEVIDNALNGEYPVLNWVDAEAIVKETSNDNKDWTFSTEHIFSLEVTDLYSLTNNYVFGSFASQIMVLDQKIIENSLFVRSTDGKNDGAEDIRGYAMQLKYLNNGYVSYKFYNSTSHNVAYRNRIPMIRLSEMFYIRAAAALVNSDTDTVADCLTQVMLHRGYTDIEIDYPTALLSLEILREFIGEGQLFYWAKMNQRLGLELPDFGGVYMENQIDMYPYPISETSYGHIQER